MQTQINHTSKQAETQGVNIRGRGEVKQPAETASRYLLQLYTMLRTARRQNNSRVVTALRSLIARRRGMA